jgi:hypothetical protein
VTTELDSPFTSGFTDAERWWQQTLNERRLRHVFESGETSDCSWPDCIWHGILPGEQNDVHAASPP